ncbi:MAG: NAD(P)H-dependent oxidoreductase [Oscillospiraceae bacterium]|nr:NAD(P)H-dependent oxidoreductase [Oscillospiraceae bacterium]
MKILVLNGSPKGEYSITLQTIRYLERKFPEQTFEVLDVGQKIKSLEKNAAPALEKIAAADVLLFSYPVYTFIAPCQLHRFLALMKEHGADVTGKIATQLTTSKHFYDVTAHRYIQDNVQEMGMHFIRGLSADMDDLTTEKGRLEAENWWKHFLWSAQQGYFEPYFPAPAPTSAVPVTVPAENFENKTGDVVIIADLKPEDTQLAGMVSRFRSVLPYATRVVNLQEYPFSGGCLGCFRCAVSGKCVHKDGFDDFLRDQIQTADAMIYAFSIQDHSMGHRFKMYDDRQFCNGHRTVTIGMPVGYLISGNYSRETNLQMILEGRAQVGSNILTGFATDEADTDAAIDRLADSLTYALEHKNTGPQNFLGIGGMKIFRDLIYQMRGFMRADHKFFKSHGQYDFPQKKWPQSLAMYLVGAMIANPKVHSKLGNKMNEGMLMPYKKVLEDMDK